MKLNTMLGTLYEEPVLAKSVAAPPKPEYKAPSIPVKPNKNLERPTRNLLYSAYGKIRKAIGSYWARYAMPSYVATVNAFNPEIGIAGGIPLPLGQVNAAYFPEDDAMLIDEGKMPGTRKNKDLKNLYKSSLRLVDKASKYLRVNAEGLKQFYRDIISDLERPPEKEFVHEGGHGICNQSGFSSRIYQGLIRIFNYAKAEQKSVQVEEGLVCAFTQEVTGRRSTIRGTSYDHYKHRLYTALDNLGIPNAVQAINRYLNGDTALPGRLARAYARA